MFCNLSEVNKTNVEDKPSTCVFTLAIDQELHNMLSKSKHFSTQCELLLMFYIFNLLI